jgi:benzoate-CoA ligase family protein
MTSGNAASHFIDRHLEEGRAFRTAFIDARGSHSYGDLAREVNQAGNLLRRRGVARGDRVALCLNDSINFPALFFGALKIGAIPVPLNTLLTSGEYAFMLRDSGAVAAIVSAPLCERFASAASGIIDHAQLLVEGDDAPPYRSFKSELTIAGNQLEAVTIDDDEPGFWLYSSGSTGKPKGVIHRHRDLIVTAEHYGHAVLGIGADDVVFSASKMFFAYGLGNSCTFPLHAGAAALLSAERPLPDAIPQLLRTHRVTVFFGFPSLYAFVLASLPNEFAPLSDLRLCISAGEALPSIIHQRWQERFSVPLLDGIGSTESLHIFMTNRPDAMKSGSSGKPVDGYEVSLRNDAGKLAVDDEIGDLWVRGNSIATGYWKNEEAARRTFVDGWLRTGDKYSRDSGGFYHYAGRTDDMLKVAGVWVSPNEVEAVLMEHPAVLEAAVVAALNEDRLPRPKAFVVLKETNAESEELVLELRQFVGRG